MTGGPKTPVLEREEIFDTARVADKNDPAFVPPSPNAKSETTGEFILVHDR